MMLDNDIRMNQLQALRSFAKVVEAGSFTRAADQLGLPRSTLSKLVLDLERHLGVRLVQRTTRQVVITAEGTAYYDRIASILTDLDDADGAIKGAGLKPSGRLRIEAPRSFADRLLIPALPDFSRQYPDIDIALGVSDRTADMIGEGVHCAIRGGTLTDPGLIARRLADFPYVTCASPAYLERFGLPDHPLDLSGPGHAVVGFFSPATERPQPLLFERAGKRLEVGARPYVTNDGESMITMLRNGMGVGQNLRVFLQPHLDRGELVPVLEGWNRPGLTFHVVYPPGGQQNARLRAFIDWLVLQKF